MGEWNKKERFEALLSGELADRSIVSGWRHILDKEHNASDLAEATIAYTKKFDWDWVKINPRATYYAEVWGNTYDLHDYRSVFPKQTRAAIETARDVWDIEVTRATQSPPLIEQLEAAKLIRQGLPDTPLIQTIFSPLTVLLFLIGQSAYVADTIYGSDNKINLTSLITENRAGVHHALHAISMTLADYVQELGSCGIDGVFYATTGTAHPDLLHEADFNEFSRPYDSIVLDAAHYGKRILHTCGEYSHPERFNDYPIEGISWDTQAAGNMYLDGRLRPTKVGGVDHSLFASNDIEGIRAQAHEALRVMDKQPFILAPNCSIPVNVTDEALQQLHDSIFEKGNV